MVDLNQFGGEGKGAYKGHKTNMNLPQHGGEGGGKAGGRHFRIMNAQP